jgi:hypothetical protein
LTDSLPTGRALAIAAALLAAGDATADALIEFLATTRDTGKRVSNG